MEESLPSGMAYVPQKVAMINRLFRSVMNSGDVRVAQFPATIGRSDESDVSIMDRFVSRRHCHLEFVDDRFFVSDLGSRHGTRVNGGEIERAEIRSGDVLQIGLLRFCVSQSGRSLLLRKVSVSHSDNDVVVFRDETSGAEATGFEQRQAVHS